MDKKQTPTPAERAEQGTLRELERQRREREAARPEAKLGLLQAGVNEVSQIERDTRDAVKHTIEEVDAAGQRHRRVGPGIPTGYGPDALVKSNFVGLKPRAEAARAIYYKLRDLIENYHRGEAELPEDPNSYLRELIATIPPGDETLVVIQSPKLGNSKTSAVKD